VPAGPSGTIRLEARQKTDKVRRWRWKVYCFENAAVTVFRPNFDPFVGTGELWMNFHSNDNCMEAIFGW